MSESHSNHATLLAGQAKDAHGWGAKEEGAKEEEN